MHKSQGMTIPCVAANLGDTEMHLGGTFTVLSRVPALTGLALERGLNFDRLAKINQSRSLLARKEYEAAKWPPLEANALRHFQSVLAELLLKRGSPEAAVLDTIGGLAETAAEQLSLADFTAEL
ncbi:unnamed protein product [Prorocentrum cordatum]|uniref:DNA helicase n=1 Tax=Prorocentrum cordatum TaxID=2364126 RepID=A0ABN9V7W6_9DINO|nr:unnamed protein product [Polarella glacialis]